MKKPIKSIKKWSYSADLLVDTKLFSKEVIFRAAYEFIDKVYINFSTEWFYIKVKFKLKDNFYKIQEIIDSFWEELVFHNLREDINKKTINIRKKIIETALWFSLNITDIKDELKNISTNLGVMLNAEELDSPKNKDYSVDELIKEISNDPDFQDADDILSILKDLDK